MFPIPLPISSTSPRTRSAIFEYIHALSFGVPEKISSVRPPISLASVVGTERGATYHRGRLAPPPPRGRAAWSLPHAKGTLRVPSRRRRGDSPLAASVL